LHFRSFSFSKVRLVKNCRACKIKSVKAWLWFKAASLAKPAPAQQSVHPTLGILARFQAFFYASAFFWLDGFAVPAPARVTQTVVPLLQIRKDDKSKQRMTESVTHGSAIFW
jgi:hypothetical protein